MARTKRLEPDKRKSEIFEIAYSIADIYGLYSIPFNGQNIANTAKCTRSLVYHYFKGVENLRDEVLKKAHEKGNSRLVLQGVIMGNETAIELQRNDTKRT